MIIRESRKRILTAGGGVVFLVLLFWVGSVVSGHFAGVGVVAPAEDAGWLSGVSVAGAPSSVAQVAQEFDQMTSRHHELPSPDPAPAPEVVPGDDLVDDEWLKFKRTVKYIHLKAKANPAAMRAEDLYRNKQLNPGDVCIPQPKRLELAVLVKSYADRCQETWGLQGKVVVDEASAAVHGGKGSLFKAKHVRLSEVRASDRKNMRSLMDLSEEEDRELRLIPSKPGSVVAYMQGVGYSVSYDDMPVFNSIVQYREFLGYELGGVIISWFQVHGYCSVSSANKQFGLLRKAFGQ